MAGILLLTAGAAWAAGSGVEVRGLSLREGGRPFVLRGLDAGNLLTADPAALGAFLAEAKRKGANAVKMDAFLVGKDDSSSLQTAGDRFDEALLRRLDAAVAAAGKAGLRVLLTLSDGTVSARYAQWAGSPNPGVFYTDFRCREWFEAYLKAVLARTNTVTGNVYSRDPALLGWVIADEPSNEAGDPRDLDRWVAETAAFVARTGPGPWVVLSLDPQSPGVDALKAAAQPGVDLLLLKGGPSEAGAFAQTCGKPVVSRPGGSAAPSPAGPGMLLAWDDPSKGVPSWNAGDVPASASSEEHLPVLLVTPGPAPLRVDEGRATFKVRLVSPAQVSLRYGLKGLLDRETPPSKDPVVSLSGLRAGEEYTVQAKAENSGGKASFSDRRTFRVPPVERAVPKSAPAFSGHFIRVLDGRFMDGERPFRWVGANNYYLHLSDDKLIDSIFADCNRIGLTVMRTWAFGCTDKTTESWPGEMDRYFVLGPGKWREKSFRDLDRVVASARRHKVRLILALANNWTDYGGAEVWAKYFGYKDKNDFFDKPEVKKAYQDYLRHLVSRTNTLTGVAYKDDPVILAWDLMNEPRYERDESGKTLAAWCDEMARFLKSCGVKQMVTTGGEGPLADGKHYSGADFVTIHQPASIDFATYHIYPASEYARWSLEATKFVIEEHVRLAREVLRKPVVMEEYGIGKRDPKYDQPVFVDRMTRDFLAAGGHGLNYWMLVDPAYQWGDGNEFTIRDVGMCNLFTLAGNTYLGGK